VTLRETRSKHSGVIAAFGSLVVKDGGFDPQLGGDLRRLFELRNAADYAWLDEPPRAEDDPVAMAERFVRAVTSWLADRKTELTSVARGVQRTALFRGSADIGLRTSRRRRAPPQRSAASASLRSLFCRTLRRAGLGPAELAPQDAEGRLSVAWGGPLTQTKSLAPRAAPNACRSPAIPSLPPRTAQDRGRRSRGCMQCLPRPCSSSLTPLRFPRYCRQTVRTSASCHRPRPASRTRLRGRGGEGAVGLARSRRRRSWWLGRAWCDTPTIW
jgi:hypothetical protein